MMRSVLCVLLMAAVAMAQLGGKKSVNTHAKSGYTGKSAPVHGKSGYHFFGKYPGVCANDGLYYNDPFSFVFCSNGNAYVQRCALGTRNSGYGQFKVGGYYGYGDFCDVNLNDFAHHAKSGYPEHYGGYYGPYYRPFAPYW